MPPPRQERCGPPAARAEALLSVEPDGGKADVCQLRKPYAAIAETYLGPFKKERKYCMSQFCSLDFHPSVRRKVCRFIRKTDELKVRPAVLVIRARPCGSRRPRRSVWENSLPCRAASGSPSMSPRRTTGASSVTESSRQGCGSYWRKSILPGAQRSWVGPCPRRTLGF